MEKGAEEIHLLSWWGDEGRGQCTIGISAATSKGTKEDVGQAHAVVTSAGAPKDYFKSGGEGLYHQGGHGDSKESALEAFTKQSPCDLIDQL